MHLFECRIVILRLLKLKIKARLARQDMTEFLDANLFKLSICVIVLDVDWSWSFWLSTILHKTYWAAQWPGVTVRPQKVKLRTWNIGEISSFLIMLWCHWVICHSSTIAEYFQRQIAKKIFLLKNQLYLCLCFAIPSKHNCKRERQTLSVKHNIWIQTQTILHFYIIQLQKLINQYGFSPQAFAPFENTHIVLNVCLTKILTWNFNQSMRQPLSNIIFNVKNY